ncbi:FdrA family protein [Pedococcus bigeumensis]|uniref:FdrA family protein n=2 Tax=Pedococcus bigeumensis TaxID=433644 RepID=A0A502D216_9MICO|nr:FdrA family protein [Pedococcus bigeumensis]
MQVSRQVASASGVEAAQVAMATELNLEVIGGMGFVVPDGVQPNELVVAIRATDDEGVANGLSALDSALAALKSAGSRSGGFGDAPAPRTLGRAIAAGEANLALVSVPGQYATIEAFDAINRGVSVMLFSDNVSVEDEVRLKDAAAASDVLVMGPDCGTAVVAGVALGFANVVERGPVGIVAASGTGGQQVMALLDAAGVGVSHCLGVGGRDLSAAVGGRSTRQALAALAADSATESILVVSKPPALEVLADLEGYAAGLGKPVHWATLGAGRPDLTAAVEAFLSATGLAVPTWPSWQPIPNPASLKDRGDQEPHDPSGSVGSAGEGRYLRGLFCGGTLADEAMLVASGELGGIRSNIPLAPELALDGDLRADDHVVIDFGDDGLTRGRAHPMIDPTLRLERIAAEGNDPHCGVLLLDLVLGHGAHPDPGPELADAIRGAREAARSGGRELPVVVSLTGAQGDPQGVSATAATLTAAGASVHLSNAEATRAALSLLSGTDHTGESR